MGKSKSHNQNIFKIIFNGLVIYLKNIVPLSKAMLFPVFGQVVGIVMILYPTFLFSENITKLYPPPISYSNLLLVFIAQIIITLPGLAIMIKAFWEFMVVMASLNTMIANLTKQGNIKDTDLHNHLFKVRAKDYAIFISILSLVWLIGLLLPGIIVLLQSILRLSPIQATLGFFLLELLSLFMLMIISVYLSLGFQVFALEDLSPIDTIIKSWNLVEGNFWTTFLLGIVAFIVTSVILPTPIQYLAGNSTIVYFLAKPFIPFVSLFINSINTLNQLAPSDVTTQILTFTSKLNNPLFEISKATAISVIGLITTSLLLPLSTAFYTLLYLDIVKRKAVKAKKK